MSDKTTLSDVLAFIRNSSKDDRAAMSAAIMSQMRHEADKAKAEFRIGDTVKWTHRYVTYTGVVERKNPKMVVVRASTGQRWRVSPLLLTKADKVGG